MAEFRRQKRAWEHVPKPSLCNGPWLRQNVSGRHLFANRAVGNGSQGIAVGEGGATRRTDNGVLKVGRYVRLGDGSGRILTYCLFGYRVRIIASSRLQKQIRALLKIFQGTRWGFVRNSAEVNSRCPRELE